MSAWWSAALTTAGRSSCSPCGELHCGAGTALQRCAQLHSFILDKPDEICVDGRIQKDRLEAMKYRWGLVPSYTKPEVRPDYFRMFNARSDDMKPVFTRLLKHRRCVVLLNGFYEWKKVHMSFLGDLHWQRSRHRSCIANPGII